MSMTFTVIENPEFLKARRYSGFSNSEFRRLAGLYSRAAAVKALFDIAVDVNFDENICTFTYFRSHSRHPYLQLVIQRVGPQTDMYEVYKEGRGRLLRSGLFSRAYDSLENEIDSLIAGMPD